ncbi:hypothetical protein BKA56DRAFT_624672 [Ilyonectria sp. MPI-CAGE-AT-0026]|nr:hypothetical protein BKA56DRAFT_624672 [Ilyonectria sp. MPI-CAGE-AT-0026]
MPYQPMCKIRNFGPLLLIGQKHLTVRCWIQRVLGQRLDKNVEPGEARSSRLSHPTIESKGRVSPSQQSLFYELHGSYCQPTIGFWVKAYRGFSIRQPSQSQIHEVKNESHSVAFNIPLNRIKNAVLPEFKGQLPVMRLNLFGIFVSSTNILRDLWGKVDEAPQIVSRGHGPPLGYPYVDAVLAQIVEHLIDEFKQELMLFWRELNMTKSVFENIDAKVSFSDYT